MSKSYSHLYLWKEIKQTRQNVNIWVNWVGGVRERIFCTTLLAFLFEIMSEFCFYFYKVPRKDVGK